MTGAEHVAHQLYTNNDPEDISIQKYDTKPDIQLVQKLHSVWQFHLHQLDLGRQAGSGNKMSKVWHLVATCSSTHWQRQGTGPRLTKQGFHQGHVAPKDLC